jgi:uncharacterized radical SAM protein YgiQ
VSENALLPHDRGKAAPFLPMSRAEMQALGWDQPDVILVTGDAYVDHPSFAMALLGRALEAAGFRVAVLAQPPWQDADAWRQLGRPRLCYAVSGGNMDSMINHYTANRKPRSDDAYSPGGRAGLRPDRCTAVYAQRCREAFPEVPIVIGGVEPSLRRLAHYDYWSDTVRPSMLVAAKADLLVYGMGERPLLTIVRALAEGKPIASLRDLRGVCYVLGARETAPADALALPSFEAVAADKVEFAHATRRIHHETNPFNARRLVQKHGDRTVVQNPPDLPLAPADMDAVYDLPYARRPHPSYQEPIPAHAMIKDSITLMRGCFGGCTFCSITTHQGRIIQSRSKASVLREVETLTADDQFKGTISDLGGPTANMYEMRCTRPEVEAICRRLSCVHPTICKLLGTDHGPLVDLMKTVRAQPGVKRALVASGVRMDLAQRSSEYMRELTAHHVGGHLKVAPEHTSPTVLNLMKKPSIDDFGGFARAFKKASAAAGKEQYLVPYFIASHPGSDLNAMIDLALYLKRNGYRPNQVQDFIPAPLDIATCMYYTGLDPITMKPVPVARALRDRKVQRALMQFWKPENYFQVREALIAAGRKDLIGNGCDALIPATAPKEALASRRAAANRDLDVKRTVGYRPGRKGHRKRG